MAIWLTLLVCVMAGAFWFWRTRMNAGSQPQVRANAGARASTNHNAHPYHCVSISYRKDACAAVARLDGKRFLPHEAPQLPLAGCDAAACRCRYVHHEDRREDDRRTPQAVSRGLASASGYSERRSGGDRRRNPPPLQFKPQIGR